MCADAILVVIPNKITGAGQESSIPSGISFNQYLAQCVPNYQPSQNHLISVERNSQPWPSHHWDYIINPGDTVVVTIEPQGTEVIYLAIVLASAYYSYRASQNIPDNYDSTSPTGSSLYSVNAQSNQPKLMGKVPRMYGSPPIVPYYLGKPRREWETDVEVLYLLLHVTRGNIDRTNATVYIGETPVTSLPDNVEYQFYDAGADLSADPAHLLEFASAEVSETELPGPIFDEQWPIYEDGEYYGWQIRADRKKLWYAYRVWLWQTGGTLVSTPGEQAWDEAYSAVISDDPIGGIFEFYGSSSNNGLYRLESISSSELLWQKLLDDLTDDTSWTGFITEFGAIGYGEDQFIAKWKFWGDGLADKWVGAYSGTPSQKTSTLYKLDFRYTGGLCEIDGSGNPQTTDCFLQIQYREIGTTAWTTQDVTHTAATLDEFVITEEISLANAIRYEFRVAKLSGGRGTSYRDDCYWVSLRSQMDSPTSYPDWSVMTMKITGSSELSDVAETKVWLETMAVLPELAEDTETGEIYWTDPVPTRKRSAAIGQVHRDHRYPDSTLDIERLFEIQQVWDTWGDNFDYYEDDTATYLDKITRYLAAGYTEPTVDYGRIVPVLDEPRSGYSQVFSRSNTTKSNPITMEVAHHRGNVDDTDAVEVEWFDPVTRKAATVLCTLGDDEGVNPRKAKAYGCIDEDHATRYGNYERAKDKYRRRIFKFGTEMSGFASKKMGRIGVAPTFPGYSQSGRIEAIDGTAITLSIAPTWTLENQISVERPDGSMFGPVPVTAGDSAHDVILSAPLDWTPDMSGNVLPPMAVFGRLIPALIISATPGDTRTATIEAVQDDERVYPYRVPD